MNISIDIHSNQLLDWLIDRRHCSRNYQNTLNKVKEELSQTLQLLTTENRESLEKSTALSYYHIQSLFDSLLKIENTDTNLFGAYNSPILKSLSSVLKSYEKNNIFLAESAMIIGRLQSYEIPYYRKQIAKLKNSQLDLDKKVTELVKRSEDSMTRYYSNCKKYGVVGDNLIQELTDLTSGLGDFLNGVGDKCKELEPAIELYLAYASKHGVFVDSRTKGGGGCLVMLKYVAKHGNTSVHEFECGSAGGKSGSSGNGTSEYELVNKDDFSNSLTSGDIMTNSKGEQQTNIASQIPSDASCAGDVLTGIDWGIEDIAVPQQSEQTIASQISDCGIDFGDAEVTEFTADLTSTINAIDFNIEIVGDSEKSGFGNNSSFNKKTCSIFEAQETRLQFLNNLEELKCFLLIRKMELDQTSDTFTLVQANESLNEVTQYIKVTDEILHSLTNQKTRDLLIMLNDCSHIEKIAEELTTKKKLSAQLKLKAESLKDALFTAAKEEQSLRPVKLKLEEESNYLKEKIENSISQLYKGRPVSILLNQ